jgi:competence protein ComGC
VYTDSSGSIFAVHDCTPKEFMKKKSKRIKRAFTLIELLVVIVIFSLLISIMLPSLIRARYLTQYNACMMEEKNVAMCLEEYRNEDENNNYPIDLYGIVQEGYIKQMPTCPSNGLGYESTYIVDNEAGVFTVSCPGIHYLVLTTVPKNYPMYIHGTGLVAK